MIKHKFITIFILIFTIHLFIIPLFIIPKITSITQKNNSLHSITNNQKKNPNFIDKIIKNIKSNEIDFLWQPPAPKLKEFNFKLNLPQIIPLSQIKKNSYSIWKAKIKPLPNNKIFNQKKNLWKINGKTNNIPLISQQELNKIKKNLPKQENNIKSTVIISFTKNNKTICLINQSSNHNNLDQKALQIITKKEKYSNSNTTTTYEIIWQNILID